MTNTHNCIVFNAPFLMHHLYSTYIQYTRYLHVQYTIQYMVHTCTIHKYKKIIHMQCILLICSWTNNTGKGVEFMERAQPKETEDHAAQKSHILDLYTREAKLNVGL